MLIMLALGCALSPGEQATACASVIVFPPFLKYADYACIGVQMRQVKGELVACARVFSFILFGVFAYPEAFFIYKQIRVPVLVEC